MRRWEYRIAYPPVDITGPDLEKSLNEAGAEGWEVYAIIGGYIHMKREILPPSQPGFALRRVMGIPDATGS